MRVYVSREKLGELQRELDKLMIDLAALRKEKGLDYTLSGDTWHDNPYFNKLTQDEEGVARRIAELRSRTSTAEVFDPGVRNTDQVRLGSIVRFARCYEKDGQENVETWEIVGFEETDVEKKRVAYNAPLGKALLGMERGDTRKSTTPRGPVEYRVLDLYTDWSVVPGD